MSNMLVDLKEKASRLSDAERAELALSLIESLDGPADPDVEEAWRVEVEPRAAQIDRGEGQLIPVDEVFPRLRRRPGGFPTPSILRLTPSLHTLRSSTNPGCRVSASLSRRKSSAQSYSFESFLTQDRQSGRIEDEGSTPEELAAYTKEQVEVWKTAVRDSGMALE